MAFFSSKSFRQIFNAANFFLVFLIFITLFNSFLTQQINTEKENNPQQQTLQVRVLETIRGKFGNFTYYVWSGSGIWQLEGKDFFQNGKEYLILGIKTNFVLNDEQKFDDFSLNLGILGKIKATKILETNQNCDWLCSAVVEIKNLKYHTQNRYFQLLCDQQKFVSQTISQNSKCQDVFGLSVGLILGGTDQFTDGVKTNFKLLGLSHLVAVSGFQVTLVVSFLELLIINLPISRKLRLLIFLFGIGFLITLVGPQPPVLRSSLSIGLSLSVLYILGRKISTLRSLFFSSLILLWINPLYLFSPSFQLSFGASFGLAFSLKIENMAELKWWQNFKELFQSTIISFLFTLPIIVYLAGFISPIAIFSNVLIVPSISIITFLNLLALIPFIGDIFMFPANILHSIIIFLVNDLSSYAKLLVLGEITLWETAIYYLALILSLSILKLRK